MRCLKFALLPRHPHCGARDQATPSTSANDADAVGDGRQLDLYSGTETNDSRALRGERGAAVRLWLRAPICTRAPPPQIPRSTLTRLIRLALHKWPVPVTVNAFFFVVVVFIPPLLLPFCLFLKSALSLFPFSVHYSPHRSSSVPLVAVRRRVLNMESSVAD